MNKQTKYDAAIRDLMHHDSNGSWNEILSDHDGDIDVAFKELISSLAVSFEENPDATIYRKIWNGLFNFMCCDALGWTYLKNSKGEYWVDKQGNWQDINVGFSGDWNSLMSLIDELEGENIEVDGVIMSVDVNISYGHCSITDDHSGKIINITSSLGGSTWKHRIITNAVMQYLLFRDDLTRKKKQEEVKPSDLVVIPEGQKAIVRAALQHYRYSVNKFANEESDLLLHDLVTLEGMFYYETSIKLTKEEKDNFTAKHGVDFPMYTK